jgi:hypothetical protein
MVSSLFVPGEMYCVNVYSKYSVRTLYCRIPSKRHICSHYLQVVCQLILKRNKRDTHACVPVGVAFQLRVLYDVAPPARVQSVVGIVGKVSSP